ncbi:MAG: haloacid dehalogenase [Anaerolineae bacterium]|nr:haloacid dehalogenase [Anaerolineae bacterium]
MADLESIVQPLRELLETKNQIRDETLGRARVLTRLCANSIRATHRQEFEQARSLLEQARQLALEMRDATADHSDLYLAGYTQDALREYAEASITLAVVMDRPIPSAGDLSVDAPAYLNALAEAVGEMRRHVLDLIRRDQMDRAEAVLAIMDEAYWQLVTVDFPSAITGNLRHNTDMVRGVLERTRADLTTSQEQLRLRQAIRRFEANLNAHSE